MMLRVLTVRPAMVTVSVYWVPLTLEPSPYVSLKDLLRVFAVELLDGLYNVCPEQVLPHEEPGRKRSLEPVSKSTR